MGVELEQAGGGGAGGDKEMAALIFPVHFNIICNEHGLLLQY